MSGTTGPTPILDFSVLTKMEAATLTDKMRNALRDLEEVDTWYPQVWGDIAVIYLEAREAFLREFFDAR